MKPPEPGPPHDMAFARSLLMLAPLVPFAAFLLAPWSKIWWEIVPWGGFGAWASAALAFLLMCALTMVAVGRSPRSLGGALPVGLAAGAMSASVVIGLAAVANELQGLEAKGLAHFLLRLITLSWGWIPDRSAPFFARLASGILGVGLVTGFLRVMPACLRYRRGGRLDLRESMLWSAFTGLAIATIAYAWGETDFRHFSKSFTILILFPVKILPDIGLAATGGAWAGLIAWRHRERLRHARNPILTGAIALRCTAIPAIFHGLGFALRGHGNIGSALGVWTVGVCFFLLDFARARRQEVHDVPQA